MFNEIITAVLYKILCEVLRMFTDDNGLITLTVWIPYRLYASFLLFFFAVPREQTPKYGPVSPSNTELSKSLCAPDDYGTKTRKSILLNCFIHLP
jgi:hypothetical protein